MAERRENSVLISLRELRQIEDERVKQEDEDARQREEAARMAREQAERAALAEQERVRREAEEVERQRVQAEQRQVREDQLRLDEAERRARVDAQMKLEQERLRLEMEARQAGTHKKLPMGLIGALAGVMVLIVGGLTYFLIQQKNEAARLEKEKQYLAQQIDISMKKISENQSATDELVAQLGAEHDEAKRKELEAQLEQKRRERASEQKRLADLRAQMSKKKGGGKKPPTDNSVRVSGCDPNDPLCGLK